MSVNTLAGKNIKTVLLNYLCPDFGCDEKPKGGPLESEIFLLRGVYEGGWRKVRCQKLDIR